MQLCKTKSHIQDELIDFVFFVVTYLIILDARNAPVVCGTQL